MLNAVDHNGTFTVSATAYTGAYSLRLSSQLGADVWARWALDGSPANPSVSLWVYLSQHYEYNVASRLRFRLDSSLYVDLIWKTATHTYDAYVNGVFKAAGTVEVSPNAWFNVQFYMVLADAGNISVKINGHQSIDWDGDTKPGAEAGASYFYVHIGGGIVPLTKYSYYDDLVLGTGGYLGSFEVYDKMVASDDTVAWTPSAGADNYAMEDEVPPSDADYNGTTVTARVDKMGLAALDLTDRVVDAVIPWSRVADPDSYGSSIKVGIDSNGTESTATSALAAAYQYYWGDVDEVDPDDSAAWNQAKVDALLHMKESVIP